MTDLKSRPEAIQACKLLGWRLAVVTTTAKRDAIQAHLGDPNLWIDGSDAAQEGTWKIEGGATVTIPFMWYYGTTECNCLYIDSNELSDILCTGRMGYICDAGRLN